MKLLEMRRSHVESALKEKNWTGYTLEELASYGRIGDPIKTAKEVSARYSEKWFDANDIKGSVENNLKFEKALAVALQAIINANQ